jgi:hypothetical protein
VARSIEAKVVDEVGDAPAPEADGESADPDQGTVAESPDSDPDATIDPNADSDVPGESED